MKRKGTGSITIYFVIMALVCTVAYSAAYAAFFYKSYVVRYDRGWNILCDPYVVKKDDWVFKLFREKGEISNKDFPEFLRIFKRLNPHIRDIDTIRPGQHILIPLKKVDQDELPEKASGVVTIPYLTNAIVTDDATANRTDYQVKKGDCVSILLSKRFGNYGTESYQNGEKLFRSMNPQIKNLNLIYAGQRILLPEPINQNLSKVQAPPQPLLNRETFQKTPERERPDSSVAFDENLSLSSNANHQQETPNSSLPKIASVLDAKLFNKGNYYLPQPGQEDYKIDLSQTPFLKLEDGKRIFFTSGDENRNLEIKMIKSFWKDALVVNLQPDDSIEKAFNTVFGSLEGTVFKHRLSFFDHGIQVEILGQWIIEKSHKKGEALRRLCITVIDDLKERTPQSIIRYLDQNNIIIKEILLGKHIEKTKPKVSRFNISNKNLYVIDVSDHENFVKDVLPALGYQYVSNNNFSFQYAGLQINATSNLALKDNDNQFYIDFGNLYGDAIHAIKESGYSIIQVKDNDSIDDIMQKLFGAMKVSFVKDPSFLAANRPADYNTRLTIPGFFLDHAERGGVLLTFAPLHHQVIRYLTDKDIRIVRIKLQGKKDE